jgi:hypothetical protein
VGGGAKGGMQMSATKEQIEHAFQCGQDAAASSRYPPYAVPYDQRVFQLAFFLGYEAAYSLEGFIAARWNLMVLKIVANGGR